MSIGGAIRIAVALLVLKISLARDFSNEFRNGGDKRTGLSNGKMEGDSNYNLGSFEISSQSFLDDGNDLELNDEKLQFNSHEKDEDNSKWTKNWLKRYSSKYSNMYDLNSNNNDDLEYSLKRKYPIRHGRSRKSYLRKRKNRQSSEFSLDTNHETWSPKTIGSNWKNELKQKIDDRGSHSNQNARRVQTSEHFVRNESENEFSNTSMDFDFGFLDSWSSEETFDNSSNFEATRDSMDLVTKFLRIIETQRDNCTKGTGFSLGDGVVDKYAHERFRLQAEMTVNLANLYTRLWKYSRQQVLLSEYLLHAEVLSLLEFDKDIFGAGNCYDRYQYPGYELFCPFAHRLPDGRVKIKDLAQQYFYLSNGSDFFLDAKLSGEKVIEKYTQIKKAFHSFSSNSTDSDTPFEEEILSVKYEDGIWTKPYYDCGGGNIWMMTYTVPFFGYTNGTYHFKGTSGIDVDLRRVDIDQCSLAENSTTRNIFSGSDKCKAATTQCVALPGLGFRRGSYKCVCRKGFYFPDVKEEHKYYNGTLIEIEYERKYLNQSSLYDKSGHFECLACAPGCEECQDERPCVVALNWVMRTTILIMTLVLMLWLPVIALLTWRSKNLKVIRAASPALLLFIILGAFFIYTTSVVQYPKPTGLTCGIRVWLREIGFALTYGALMLKTWRISMVFSIRSAKAVKITDVMLLRRLGLIVGVFATFLAVRTVVATPKVMISFTQEGLKASLCSTDWWDHTFTAMEISFLIWGIRLCIVVRKAPSEFNESKFISMAIYNEFLLTLFLNVSMLFLRSPANPDLLFIIHFSHTQLTVTLLLALIFGSKAYMVLKGQGKAEELSALTKTNTNKLHLKIKSNSRCGYSPAISDCTSVDDIDLQNEFKRLFLQLESLKERYVRINNHELVAKISAMQDAALEANLDLSEKFCDDLREWKREEIKDNSLMEEQEKLLPSDYDNKQDSKQSELTWLRAQLTLQKELLGGKKYLCDGLVIRPLITSTSFINELLNRDKRKEILPDRNRNSIHIFNNFEVPETPGKYSLAPSGYTDHSSLRCNSDYCPSDQSLTTSSSCQSVRFCRSLEDVNSEREALGREFSFRSTRLRSHGNSCLADPMEAKMFIRKTLAQRDITTTKSNQIKL